jgi:hypothetical protein
MKLIKSNHIKITSLHPSSFFDYKVWDGWNGFIKNNNLIIPIYGSYDDISSYLKYKKIPYSIKDAEEIYWGDGLIVYIEYINIDLKYIMIV